MKLTISRTDLISKMEAEVKKREADAKKFNEGIEARWIATRDKKIVELKAKIAGYEKVKMTNYNYMSSCSFYLPSPESKKTARTQQLLVGIGILKMCTDSEVTMDTQRDKLGIAAAVTDLFHG